MLPRPTACRLPQGALSSRLPLLASVLLMLLLVMPGWADGLNDNRVDRCAQESTHVSDCAATGLDDQLTFQDSFEATPVIPDDDAIAADEHATPTPFAMEPYVPPIIPQTPTVIPFGAHSVTVHPIAERFPEVTLKVTVLDSERNAVTGLTEADFSVWEQSTDEQSPVAQMPTSFEEASATDAGLSFALVFDVSGSMDGQRLADAKTAAQ